MQIEETGLAGVLKLTPKRFGDERGYFSEVYSRARFAEAGIGADFVQDNQSWSRRRGTIRGLHFQTPPRAQGKLVRVVAGAVLDVAVDLRHGSPTYGRHAAVELSADNGAELWVPPGFAHGFCTLTDDAIVLYKTTEAYSPDCDRGLAFDDPALGIAWPVAAADAVVSDKDRRQPRLADLPAHFNFGGS